MSSVTLTQKQQEDWNKLSLERRKWVLEEVHKKCFTAEILKTDDPIATVNALDEGGKKITAEKRKRKSRDKKEEKKEEKKKEEKKKEEKKKEEKKEKKLRTCSLCKQKGHIMTTCDLNPDKGKKKQKVVKTDEDRLKELMELETLQKKINPKKDDNDSSV